jgi:hypothetical protein
MGAIFAATDSVATLQVLDRETMPGLFSLVFGEGVVNDAGGPWTVQDWYHASVMSDRKRSSMHLPIFLARVAGPID